jgi:hypothetical protein
MVEENSTLDKDGKNVWLAINKQRDRFIISEPTFVTAPAGERFAATQILEYKDKGKQQTLGNLTFIISFSKSAFPKISVALDEDSFKIDPACVDTGPHECARQTYWNDVGLKDMQWIWALAPASGYDKYQSKTFGGVNITTVAAILDEEPSVRADFKGTKNWYADWSSVGPSEVAVEPSTVSILGQSVLIVRFAVNMTVIDPTFGLTSTGSTSYPTAKAITANGNAQIDTAQSKFGGASGLFDGNGDYLSTPDSADWAFGTGDFTIDFWVRFAADIPYGDYVAILAQQQDANNRWMLMAFRDAGGRGWELIHRTGGSVTIDVYNYVTINVNTWYHVAVVRSGNSWLMFQDGTQIGSTATDADPIADMATVLCVGQKGDDSKYFNGWLDEFRVSKGVARWTSNFTPPTARYDRDSSTVYLDHMDGTDTSTTFLDDVTTGVGYATKATLSDSNATVSKISFYSHAAGNVRVSLFSDSSGPSSKLCESADTAVSATAWTDATVTGCGTLASGSYWLAWQWNPGAAYLAGPSYASGSASTGNFLYQAYGAFPASWSGGTASAENYSIYATYTAGQAVSKSLADVLSGADSLGRGFLGKRSGAESGSLVDTVAKLRNVPKSISDILALVDSLAFKYVGERTLTDTLSLTDSLAKLRNVPAALSDAVSWVDSLTFHYIGVRTLSDALAWVDSITRLRNVPKPLADALTLTDSLGFQYIGSRSLADILSVTDSLAYLRDVPASISDILTFLDDLSRTYIGERTNVDILTLTDQLATGTGKPLTDTASLTDVLSRMLMASWNPTETISLSDVLSHLIGKPLTDLLTESDTLTRGYVGLRSASDIDALIDIMAKVVGKPLAENLMLSDLLSRLFIGQLTLSDTLTVFDALSHLIGMQATDLLTFVDFLGRGYIGTRGNTDIMTLADELAHDIGKPLADTSQLADTLLRSLIAGRSNTDILALSDLLSHDVGKPIIDAFTFTDTLLRELFASRSPTDIVNISDQLTQQIGKPLAENLIFNDILVRLLTGERTVAELISVTDLLGRNYVGLRALTDYLQFLDMLSTGRFLSASLTDQLQLVDALLSQYFGIRAPTDVLSLTDSLLKGSSTQSTETLNLTDTLMKSSGIRFAELLTFLDNLERLYRGQVNPTESILITDVAARQYGSQIVLNEILTITENLVAVYTPSGAPSTITVNISDLFNLSDLIGKLLTPAAFGVTGGEVSIVAPLVQIQLAAIPRIATLDYITANPMSIQLFLFKPSSILQVLFTATNGNRTPATVDLWFDVSLGGKPYMTTPKSQQTLSPGVPTNIYSWLLIDQPGTYQIIPHAEAAPTDPNFSTVTLPTQTVTVELWQIFITTVILWGIILGPMMAVVGMVIVRTMRRRREIKEAKEE